MYLRPVIITVALIVILIGVMTIDVHTFLDERSDSEIVKSPPIRVEKESQYVDTQRVITPMARTLAEPSGSVQNDLRALMDIFNHHTQGQTKLIPTGTNQEITLALTQANPSELPYIPKDHPAINSQGELTDRWGTPYFFHALSSINMEVRSAGPDRIMYSNDDYIWPTNKINVPKPKTFESEVSIR